VTAIDVIVVCWNDKDKIATALDSVFALSEVRSDPAFARVVVSDNGSSDGSREFIRQRYGERVMSSRTAQTSVLRPRATARSPSPIRGMSSS
jgi:glycosyltransferase involved in cell wall biosynthesis